MTSIPTGRTTHLSCYSPGGETPAKLNGTWLEAESFAYPSGGFTRRAYVVIAANHHNPVALPYGARRVVRCSIPDTCSSIPARFRFQGRTVKGYITVLDGTDVYSFLPEGI